MPDVLIFEPKVFGSKISTSGISVLITFILLITFN
ncbi:hypothetical protein PSY27_23945, partial [Shigella flexneri]|nr:hypothetical protein [Shigella flexneri]